MRRIGISIYPGHASKEENLKYIETAHKYGFTRIFTCLISVKGDKETIIKEFKETIEFANSLGFEVIADVNPAIFEELGVSYEDLGFFKEMGLKGIRLDLSFSGAEESLMTFNEYDLEIETNMSIGSNMIDNIMSYKPNKEKLIACHNFYPHKHSGLSYETFLRESKKYKKYGLRTAAFVSAENAPIGPWPVSEGLCTIEDHRNRPIDAQAKYLFKTDLIDDVIIGNAFADEAQLKALGEVNRELLEINVDVVEGISDVDRAILFGEIHCNRGDQSPYLIRSSKSRVKYRGTEFKPFNTVDIKRGDIIIDNSLYNSYAGEMQIALKDMTNEGKVNVVGRINEDDLFLLDEIGVWDKFRLKEK